jgi:hypothetical protein
MTIENLKKTLDFKSFSKKTPLWLCIKGLANNHIYIHIYIERLVGSWGKLPRKRES